MAVYNSRSRTKGNTPVDYTKLRGNIDLENINSVASYTLKNAVPRNGKNPEAGELTKDDRIGYQKLEKLSNIIANNINAATDLRQITPYIDKAELIWSTLMLFPNGVQKKILTHDTANTRYKNAVLHKDLLNVWDDYYTNDYKIEAELRPMLNDIMWNTGSYVKLHLSRPMLDNLINGSQPVKVAGNEAYIENIRDALSEHFIDRPNGEILVRNTGKYIRDPKSKSEAVSGLEHAFGIHKTYDPGVEFPLFNGLEEEVKDFDKMFGNITFTDNLSALFLQRIHEKRKEDDAAAVIGAESFLGLIGRSLKPEQNKDKAKNKPKPPKEPTAKTQNLSMAQLEGLQNQLFPIRDTRVQDVVYVKASDELSVAPFGTPISFHVPSEACITIHHNGSTKGKKDYIILFDGEGNFLKSTKDFEFYQSIAKQNNSIANKNKNGSENSLIASLRQVQEGKECDFDMSEFVDLASSMVIRQYMKSIISGKEDNISITLDEETNKIFLTRLFKRQRVRCLYVPGECITYAAFKYNRLGLGQSLTQQAKLHIARLAALDLADTLANLEMAQPHTLLTVNLEKEDDDPNGTIAMIRHAFFENNPRLHNLLSTAQLSVPQIVDALREQSLTVKVNAGENTRAIGVDMDLTPMEKQIFKPVDDASRQDVLNKIANYFILPRSWLDVSDDQNNFQIEALTEHQMILNQAINWQDMFCDHIIDMEKKQARVNEPLLMRLINIITENRKNWTPDSKEEFPFKEDAQIIELILNDFFTSLYCELPRPTSNEITTKLKDSLDNVTDLVDRWMQAYATKAQAEDIIRGLGINMEGLSEQMMSDYIKGHFTGLALKLHNIPLPFDEIIENGKGGGMASLAAAIAESRKNYGSFVVQFAASILDADKDIAKENKKAIAKINDAQTDEQSNIDPYAETTEEDAPPSEDPTIDNELEVEDENKSTEEDIVDDEVGLEDDLNADKSGDTKPGENPY